MYYQVRTVVRTIFWGSVAGVATLSLVWIADRDQLPECPILLNRDFTYETQAPFDPATCWAGDHVEILDSLRWGWKTDPRS
jgi:hypothetical protein